MPANPRIDQILKAEWPSIKRQLLPSPSEPFNPNQGPPLDFISWDPRLSPGFPSQWPCPPNAQLIYYAWAYGSQLRSLRDAVRTALPWARFTVSLADGGVTYQLLADKPSMGDTQGMWPLSPADSALSAESRALFDELPAVLSRQGDSPDESWLERVKLSYCLWIKCNGVTAHQIRPLHPEFFAWLEAASL